MRYLSLIVIALLLAGCNSNIEKTRLNKLSNLDLAFWRTKSDLTKLPPYLPLAELNDQWSLELDGSLVAKLRGQDDSILAAEFQDNTLFVSQQNGLIQKIDLSKGVVIDEIKLSDDVSTAPVFFEGLIYVGTKNGELQAYDKDFKLLWAEKVLGEILATPSVDHANIAVQTTNGKIYLFDRVTHKQLWVYTQEIPILSIRGTSTPLLHENVVITGFANGKFIGLNRKTGLPIWERRIAFPKGQSDLAKLVDVNIDPVLSDGIVYISAYRGNLVAIQAKTGEMIWNRAVSTIRPLSIKDNLLVIVDNDDIVWGFDKRSGKVSWKHQFLKGRKLTGACIWNEVVVVGDSGGYAHVLSKLTGLSMAQKQAFDSEQPFTPAVHGQLFYVINHDEKEIKTFSMIDHRIERFKKRKAAGATS